VEEVFACVFGGSSSFDSFISHCFFGLGEALTRQREGKRARRTFVQRPRIHHHDRKLLPGPLRFQQHPLDDARTGIGEDHVAVVDLVNRVLLDHAVGEEDSVSDEGVEFGEEKGFGLRARKVTMRVRFAGKMRGSGEERRQRWRKKKGRRESNDAPPPNHTPSQSN
jgi:hypothetical protein